MERGTLSVIPAMPGRLKITPIAAVLLAVALCLLSFMISDLCMMIHTLDLALCDLRRKLDKTQKAAPASSYTATISLTPDTAPMVVSAPVAQRDERTEHI